MVGPASRRSRPARRRSHQSTNPLINPANNLLDPWLLIRHTGPSSELLARERIAAIVQGVFFMLLKPVRWATSLLFVLALLGPILLQARSTGHVARLGDRPASKTGTSFRETAISP